MANPGTLTHRKTRRLARLLGIPVPCALGVMEALWHATAQHAPNGDIGRLADRDIADEIWWEGKPEELVGALVDAGLVDHDGRHRLVVHDWNEHGDKRVACYRRRRQWVRAAGGAIRSELRRFIFERDGFRCLTCGDPEDLTVDHIAPISRGGTNELGNLRTLCRSCNSRKGDREETFRG